MQLFPVFQIVCWGLPIVLTSAAIIEGALGPDNSSVSVGWCWIKQECSLNSSINPESCLPDHNDIKWQLVDAKGWEILSYFLVAVICVVIKCHMTRKFHNDVQIQPFVVPKDFELKLILIPVVFILIRIWGTIRYFMTLKWNVDTLNEYCKSTDYLPVFLALQAMGDPAQGWANCILYCLLTRKIRNRLFSCFCSKSKQDDEEKTKVESNNTLPSPRLQNLESGTENEQSSELLSVASDRTPLMSTEAENMPTVITGPVCGSTPPKH